MRPVALFVGPASYAVYPLRAEAFLTQAAIVRRLGATHTRPHMAVLLASLREALIRGSRSRLFCLEALAPLRECVCRAD